MQQIEFDGLQPENTEWVKIMGSKLKDAKRFEIHCWEDETEEIAMALRCGELKETDWRGGKVIAGAITPELIGLLLTLPKSADTEVYHKMTPFFSIFLDNGFSSEHYGTELNQQ